MGKAFLVNTFICHVEFKQITKYVEIIREKGHVNMKQLGVRKNVWGQFEFRDFGTNS